MTVLDLARKFRFVRELAGNKGQRVEALQRWCGGTAGDSWCAAYATMVLDVYYEGKSPVPRTMSCDVILETARQSGMLTDLPLPGDLYLRLRTKHDAHHVGFVTDVSQWARAGVLGTLSGNTSNDGTSSNGDGVYEHAITVKDQSTIVFVHYTP